MDRVWKGFEVYARKGRDCHEGTGKGDSGESSDRKESW